MDFADRSEGTQRHAWVGEALSELLTADLSRSRKIFVIDRENVLEHYQEMALSQTGLVTPESASRFGSIAQADYVVFGAYAVKAKTISIEARVIDLSDGRILGKAGAEGELKKLLSLENKLALKILAAMKVAVDPDEESSIAGLQTVSIEAVEAYYQGCIAIRNKELERGLGSMLSAIHNDPHFAEPYFMVIDIYRSLGYKDHAQIARASFYKHFPDHKLVFRELYNQAEELRKEGRLDDAREIYRKIVDGSLGIYVAGAWTRLAEMTGNKDEKIARYKKALRIRPDIGMFKESAVKALYKLDELKGEVARAMCFAPVREVRRTAYEAVVKAGDREGIEALHDAYMSEEHGSHENRYSIANLLLNYGTEEDWTFLIDAAKSGHGVYPIAVHMCSKFAGLKYEPFLDDLPEILMQIDPKQRGWAISTLTRWPDPRVEDAIRTVVASSKDHRPLISGCKTLARLGDKDAVPILLPLLEHDYYQKQTRTYEVRKAAYEALIKLGHNVPEPVLYGEGFASPTLTGTAELQGIERENHPTVAVMISRQNAEGVSWGPSGKGYGYRTSLANMNVFLDRPYRTMLHFNPWQDRDVLFVELGSSRVPRFVNKEYLKEHERISKSEVPILSAASLEDFELADTVICAAQYNIEPEVITALKEYVHGGGGLVVFEAFYMVTPKRIPEFYELMGFPMGSGTGTWIARTPDVTHFTAVAEHELVRGMPLGVPMPYGRNFFSGLVYTDSMLLPQEHTVLLRTDNPVCEAVIVREYGKGRIVIINWAAYWTLDSRVGQLTSEEFYIRCVDWAGRLKEKYADPWNRLPGKQLSARQRKWLAEYDSRWNKKWEGLELAAKPREDPAAGVEPSIGGAKLETFAVLPFINLTGSRKLDPLAESMAPVLGTLLEESSDLQQVEREEIETILAEHKISAAQLTDEKSAIKIGKLLGAKYILICSMLESEGELTLNCRLQDCATTVVLAAGEGKGRTDDILSPMKIVAESLLKDFKEGRVSVSFPADPTPLANLHYMKGLGYMNSGDMGRALGELTIAYRYSPSHTNTRKWLAKVYNELGQKDHATLVSGESETDNETMTSSGPEAEE